jgi:hypothetical protein
VAEIAPKAIQAPTDDAAESTALGVAHKFVERRPSVFGT